MDLVTCSNEDTVGSLRGAPPTASECSVHLAFISASSLKAFACSQTSQRPKCLQIHLSPLISSGLSLNRIELGGSFLMPAVLLLLRSPFLFGYAKPVPVNFRALKEPRRDMVFVAAAGPATNIALATLAALFFHVTSYLPPGIGAWVAQNLKNALIINVVLAVFNMLPLPPLDGGRVAVGLLPKFLVDPLANLEPYGMMILITLLFFLPMFGAQMSVDLNIISRLIGKPTELIVRGIIQLTGNG